MKNYVIVYINYIFLEATRRQKFLALKLIGIPGVSSAVNALDRAVLFS